MRKIYIKRSFKSDNFLVTILKFSDTRMKGCFEVTLTRGQKATRDSVEDRFRYCQSYCLMSEDQFKQIDAIRKSIKKYEYIGISYVRSPDYDLENGDRF